MFKRKQPSETEQKDGDLLVVAQEDDPVAVAPARVASLFGLTFEIQDEETHALDQFARNVADCAFEKAAYQDAASSAKRSEVLVALFPSISELDQLLDAVIVERKARSTGLPVLIIVINQLMLTEFGDWLMERAEAGSLEGIRIVAAQTILESIPEVGDKFQAIHEPNVLSMPFAPEVDDSPTNYFFAISPQMRKTVRMIGELAENGIERIYLLGGPGSGKTSLAYYYWQKRNKGRFLAVNLNAESSGDKDAMKSLLCGHVTGAFPGASSREGAFSYADGGVTFLDESHGVTGVVMQVLMEALDSGQYLPFGATKKRALDCAVIFASNRSWEQLREQIDLDEHARLGAMIVPVHDLVVRREDLIVGVAIALSRFKKKCTTWEAPTGLTEDAWRMMITCIWSGNMRTLFRVMETALVAHSVRQEESTLLDGWDMQEGLTLWEPESHHSQRIYTSYR